MQSPWITSPFQKSSPVVAPERVEQLRNHVESSDDAKFVHFNAHFQGYMEMYSDSVTIATYLQAHEGWFCRCAEPMKTEPMGENGYILTVGRFGSFGYEVEPKMAVILEPPKAGIYDMYSVPIPNEPFLGYEIDYHASMSLTEIPREWAGEGMEKAYRKQGLDSLPATITKVQWELKMAVAVQFPKFIYRLPMTMIRTTGDRVLAQIIRQVSPRLTHKVQEDFHTRHHLPIPPKASRYMQQMESETDVDTQVA